jgi:branched-chain amino acid transport system substrate-binding protein
MSMKQEPRDEPPLDPHDSEGLQFDRFARSAGASLRSEAPKDGMTALLRQGSRQKIRRLAIEIGVVGALVVSGIALLKHSDGTQPNFNPPSVPTTETTPQIVSANDPRIGNWFLDYTGNPAGPAVGEPVKFAMRTFAYRFALDAAVKYLNAQAGGVGGRPIALDVCQQTLAECADRFAADPAIVAVLENEWAGASMNSTTFSDSMGVALAGRKPLHTTLSTSGTKGVSYYPSYREAAVAMTLQAEKLTAPGAKVLVAAGTAGSPDTSSLENREIVVVQAGPEALVDTIRRAGATDAAAVVLAAPPFSSAQVHPPNGELLCDDFANALNELGMHAAVIVDTCDPHEGWYALDSSFNETSPDLQSGALPITTKMKGLGDSTVGHAIRDVRETGALLAVIRVINQLGGPTKANPAALDRALRQFTGPAPVGAGPLDCTPTGKLAQRVQPGSCVQFVDVHRFVNGRWIDQPPIDLST